MPGFIIANKSEAGDPQQAKLDRGDFEIVRDGFVQYGVISGCAVTAQGSPNNTVAVAAGTVVVNNVRVTVTSGNVTMVTADPTHPRHDFLCVNSSGTKSWVAGTANATPEYPEIPANSVVLATMFVRANDTTIAAADITDKRIFVRDLPLLVVDDPTEVDLTTVNGLTTLTLLQTIARSSKTVNVQTGTSYTLAVDDADKIITLNNAAAINLIFPQDSDVDLALGAQGVVICMGAGDVTPIQGTGAVLMGGGTLTTPGWRLIWTKVAANTFAISAPEYAAYLNTAFHELSYNHNRFPIFSTPLGATSTAVNNSTTLIDCTGVLLSLVASAVYEVEAWVTYQTAAAADLKIGWTIPSGATGLWGIGGAAVGISTSEGDWKNNGANWTATNSVGGIGATTLECRPKGIIRTTSAGDLQMQFAQQTADASNTTIRAQTYLRAIRIS